MLVPNKFNLLGANFKNILIIFGYFEIFYRLNLDFCYNLTSQNKKY